MGSLSSRSSVLVTKLHFVRNARPPCLCKNWLGIIFQEACDSSWILLIQAILSAFSPHIVYKQMKANKAFLAAIVFFFDSNSHRTNFDISSFTQRFYSKAVVIKTKRLWFFRCFNWQNVFPRWPPFQNSLINGWKVSCGRPGK